MARKSQRDRIADLIAASSEAVAAGDREHLADMTEAQLAAEIDARCSAVESRVAHHFGQPMPADALHAAYEQDAALCRARDELNIRKSRTVWTG